jgi:hypothetical protein
LVIQVEGSHYPDSSMRGYFSDQLDGWSEWNDGHPGTRFVLPLAPDRYHKENVSGGEPYGMALPDRCVDGLFVAESTMPFVSDLNSAFDNGGFPWPSSSDAQWRVRHDLRKDMLPL